MSTTVQQADRAAARLTVRFDDRHRADAVLLLRDYEAELGISLEFQSFGEELAAFPGPYAPPRGALVLALAPGAGATDGEEHLVGMVGLRPLAQGVCEMKRLYVAPDARGRGLGLRMCERLIEEARRIGYRAMRLDTLERLRPAGSVYRRLGFRPCADYNGNPVPGVRFFEKELG